MKLRISSSSETMIRVYDLLQYFTLKLTPHPNQNPKKTNIKIRKRESVCLWQIES